MPLMAKRRSGVIVNIGSVVGELLVVHSFAYYVPLNTWLAVPHLGVASTAPRRLPFKVSAKLYQWKGNLSISLSFMSRVAESSRTSPSTEQHDLGSLTIPSTPLFYPTSFKGSMLVR